MIGRCSRSGSSTRPPWPRAPTPAVLADLEQRLGAPHLWDALVADRRIYLGPKAVFSQDYAPRWSHGQMLSILQQTATGLERLCDELQPDMVVSFICVTAADYLGWRVGRRARHPLPEPPAHPH